MLELEEALARLVTAIEPPAPETLPTRQAFGRILAETVTATVSLPPFDNSAMDGYAVRAEDLRTARKGAPVVLEEDGVAAAGDAPGGPLQAGRCRRIFTGSPLPPGADAVVMQEDTELDPAQARQVRVLDAVRPWENVRLLGEDIKVGDTLLTPGDRLTAGPLGLLAAAGRTTVTVGRRPVVGLLSTGNELVEPGQPLPPGGIYESNRAMLAPLIEQAGGTPRLLPCVEDSLEATERALTGALESCDAVVTSGGVSVGEKDFVRHAFRQLGGELDFWRVAIKPGKPFCFGKSGRKLLFGLPGNPVSAAVTFLLLVRPALLRWQGAHTASQAPEAGACILSEPLHNRGDRRHFVRVRVDASGHARSAGGQASHLLSSLARANGLIDVPPRQTLAAGAVVPVLRFGG